MEQLKKISEVLHQRGIRERMLQRTLDTNMIYACHMCGKGKTEGKHHSDACKAAPFKYGGWARKMV